MDKNYHFILSMTPSPKSNSIFLALWSWQITDICSYLWSVHYDHTRSFFVLINGCPSNKLSEYFWTMVGFFGIYLIKVNTHSFELIQKKLPAGIDCNIWSTYCCAICPHITTICTATWDLRSRPVLVFLCVGDGNMVVAHNIWKH